MAKEKKKEKKWKGKDWFTVLAPKLFEGKVLAEIPATDPKSIVGRNIEKSLAGLTGNQSKSHMKFKFKIANVTGKEASTVFNGYSVIKEYTSRPLRKNTQKVELTSKIKMKDGWLLRAKTITILNRNTTASIKKKVRLEVEKFLEDLASKSTLDDFLKLITIGSIQKNIRKLGNKIYPVRFCEIAKLEVLRAQGG